MLMSEHGISFEDVVFALQSGGLLDDMVRAIRQEYPCQRMFVVRIDDYPWLVPYVENDDAFFLKTIIPSRSATKQYLGGKHA